MGIALTEEQKRELLKDSSLANAVGFSLPEALVSLQNQLDAMPIAGTIDNDAMADDAVGAAELADDLADLFVAVSWGTPGAEAGNAIEVVMQIIDAKGEALAQEHVLEMHASDTADGADSATATLSEAAVPIGTLVSGDDTAAIRFKTDAAGQFAVEVAETADAARFLSVRPCYGTPAADCRDVLELDFN